MIDCFATVKNKENTIGKSDIDTSIEVFVKIPSSKIIEISHALPESVQRTKT